MKPGAIVVVAFFLLICLWPGQALAEQEKENHITWLILDLPPFFLTDGPDKGSGLADRIQEMVAERLSGRRHRYEVANASRIARELKKDRHVCFAGEFYGNSGFLTSAPTVALLPHNIIFRREDAHRFGGADTVSLNLLLKNRNLVLGTAQDRLHGPELNRVLERHAGAAHIYRRSGKDTLEGLLKMLLKGRVDYIIEYPASIRYMAKMADAEERIAMVGIEENSQAPLIRGAIRCPDTEWGRQMIRKINDILIDIRSSPEYRKAVRDWALPPGREKEYWKIYEEQILNVKE